MIIGPFLRRELTTSVRRAQAFHNRLNAVATVIVVVALCVVTWDRWWGWDRSSIAGAAAFGLATFGWIVAAQTVVAMVLVPVMVAPRIASERDRKSLDALLSTQLSSAEIVLGTIAAGLVSYANGLAAVLPVAVLLVFLGGVDPRLVLLAGAGLASTALALAALSVAVSVSARTAQRALSGAALLAMTWMLLPQVVLILLPRLWSAVARALAPVALFFLESSPTGVLANFSGILPSATFFDAVTRMMALQAAGAALLILWAIWRLRPASRALYDVEGRTLVRRMLRLSQRRPPPRPACGDDPVLWHTIHFARRVNAFWRLVDRLFSALWIGVIAWATSWFALPAFSELAQRGYGAMREGFTMPEVTPFLRVVANALSVLSGGPAPGQARLEFNIVLRQFSASAMIFYIMAVMAVASESVETERRRDTWLGLIATPLTGWEIVRGKMLGALWRARHVVFILIALWVVGLLAGAVHPLGLLAAFGANAVLGAFFAALGVSASLHKRDPKEAADLLFALFLIVATLALLFLLPLSAIALTWGSLLTYEDVYNLFNGGAFPQFGRPTAWPPGPTAINKGMSARMVIAIWLLVALAYAASACWLIRAMCRGFDATVGRPVRPRRESTERMPR